MAEDTGIEWCDSTFNPWMGCTRVSPACDDCYAARSTPARAMGIVWGPGEQRRRTAAATWKQPKHWNDAHAEFFAQYGRRRRVFCASLADVFDNEVPAEWRADLFRLIAATPNLDWLLLTKRIGNAQRMLPPSWLRQPVWGQLSDWPHNVRIGATFCNQAEVNRDMHKLLSLGCPNFASLEPLLGPIELTRVERHEPDHGREGEGGWTYRDNALTGFSAHKNGGHDGKRLDWVIAGGESGPKARPSHPDWYRSLRDQCEAASVPFLFKQWGEWAPYDRGATDSGALATACGLDEPLQKFGKKAAGRLLDGVTHDGFPEVAHG